MNPWFVRLRFLAASLVVVAGALWIGAVPGRAQEIPGGWQGHRVRPIGYHDLEGRGGTIKLAIKEHQGRWYLYMAHTWRSGWSIVDVTDPTNPQYVKFLAWPNSNTWTHQVEIHGDIMLTGLQLLGFGQGDRNQPFDEGVVIWDVSDPVNPRQLSHWKTGRGGTHRNGYPGGRYANLAAGMPGFRSDILVFLDISDPRNPKEVSRFWLPGQKEDEPLNGPLPRYHGPAIIQGNRAYLGYSPAVVVLDISDITQPKMISRLDFAPPFGGIVVHDAALIPGKNLLYARGEASGAGDRIGGPAACTPAFYLNGLIDISDETRPRYMVQFPLPVPPPNAPYKTFCDKGGRFGPHNTNITYHSPFVEKQGDLVYTTYFNAGLRIVDISEPRLPREVGWFIPPTPTRRLGPLPEGALVNQTEDVLVDTRGNIYISDKQWGLWILRYEGEGQPAPVTTTTSR